MRDVNAMLSGRAKAIWAKSVYRGDPDDHRYLRLWQHLRDTAAVTRRVWEEFLPESIKNELITELGGEQAALGLVLFLAMIHDVGKASPAFETQCDYLCDRVREHGLKIDTAYFDHHPKERSAYRHELVGYQAVLQWFGNMGYGVEKGDMANGIAYIVGSHHGTCVTEAKIRLLDELDAYRYIGGDDWSAVRQDIIDWAARETDFLATLELLGDRPLPCRTQILLTAVVIISDWIASDAWLFPMNSSGLDEQCFDEARRVRRAWRLLNLPRPWQVRLEEISPNGLFAERFDIPGARLRPVQREAVRLARTMPKPGLMIIEANMGEGKTEAALLAAEVLAGRFGDGGIYYALPTQTTANAMFHRMLEWIGRLPAPAQGALGSVFLSHGKREQNAEYYELEQDSLMEFKEPYCNAIDELIFVDDEDVGSENADECELIAGIQAIVNAWLSGRKRGNLADFVLGTVDQGLMMSLQSKHVMLRHLAFAGKVVVFDEIHSNTAYMNVYLETTLSWLGAYGTPVIMLSATLPQSRRRAFLEAYRKGAATRSEKPHKIMGLSEYFAANLHADCQEVSGAEQLDMRYPLISYVSEDEPARSIAPRPSGRQSVVQIQRIEDDDEVLVELLRSKLREGGCAVVVRDTVNRAQSTYDVLCAAFGDVMDVSLTHARYLACDRSDNESRLLERFGKDSVPAMRQGIVVATQVVEQSLDVDFDLMVSDIAPVDLILQRAGRLHRHQRGEGEKDRPEPLRNPQLYISGMEACDGKTSPQYAGGVARVYEKFFLMRTAAQLKLYDPTPTCLKLPEDISSLVQTVYDVDSDCCPSEWGDAEHVARRQLFAHLKESEGKAQQYRIFKPYEASSSFSLDDWLKMCMPDPDMSQDTASRQARASVRDSDDSFEALVLQYDDEGILCLPEWVDASAARVLSDLNGAPSPEQVRKVLACSISLSRAALRLRSGGGKDADKAGGPSVGDVITALEKATPRSWMVLMQGCPALRGQLPIVLDASGKTVLPVRYGKNDEYMTQLFINYSLEKGWETHVNNV